MQKSNSQGYQALFEEFVSTPLHQALASVRAMEQETSKTAAAVLPVLELQGTGGLLAKSDAAINVNVVNGVGFDERFAELATTPRFDSQVRVETTEQVIEAMLRR